MINQAIKYICKDDPSKIENYHLAVNDKTQTWHCHHRLELTMNGEYALSRKDLLRMGMYYHRPYFELIFLTKSAHSKLHTDSMPDEQRQKISKSLIGHTMSDEGKKRIGKANKRRKVLDETRRKMSELMKGRKMPPRSEEWRRKQSEARKGRTPWNKGLKLK